MDVVVVINGFITEPSGHSLLPLFIDLLGKSGEKEDFAINGPSSMAHDFRHWRVTDWMKTSEVAVGGKRRESVGDFYGES